MPTSNVDCGSARSLILVQPKSSCVGSKGPPRQMAEDDGLEALSIEQLEALYAGLMRLCAVPSEELGALVRAWMDGRV